MKPFTLFIAELNDGQTAAALTGHLSELFAAVKTHGLAGSLKLNIKVIPAAAGNTGADKINVVCESQLALPKPKQPADFFFLTDDAQPTRRHPKQHELALREVQTVAATTPVQPITPEAALAATAQRFSAPDAEGEIRPISELPAPRAIG